VDGQSFAPIGVQCLDWLIIKRHCTRLSKENDQFFTELEISFVFSALHTKQAELTIRRFPRRRKTSLKVRFCREFNF
jgi:hypothetical protein